jgi:hypothetical protein
MYVNKYPEVFKLPDGSKTIWRYMDLRKFLLLLQSQALFFCRSDKFDDHLEGSYPRASSIEEALVQIRGTFADDPSLPERIEQAEQMLRSRRQLRAAFLINCWHIDEHESAAMWKLYAQSNNGIVIKSTVQRLKNSIRCLEDVLVGEVNYLDYDTAAFESMNIFHSCMSKRKSFAYEQELRAVIYDPERFDGPTGLFPVPEHKRNHGANVSIDLELLIDEIRVLPSAPDEFRESILSLCEKYSVEKEVKQSRLDDGPLY